MEQTKKIEVELTSDEQLELLIKKHSHLEERLSMLLEYVYEKWDNEIVFVSLDEIAKILQIPESDVRQWRNIVDIDIPGNLLQTGDILFDLEVFFDLIEWEDEVCEDE